MQAALAGYAQIGRHAGWRGAFALPKPGLEVYAGNQIMVGCTAEAWQEANAPISLCLWFFSPLSLSHTHGRESQLPVPASSVEGDGERVECELILVDFVVDP